MSVVSIGSEQVMGQCNHEEADTRIIVHVRHSLEGGAESVLVRTVDTDVVVILVGKLHDLLAYNRRAKIWVAFGMGRHYSLIDINTICLTLGESRALPVFHAFTGCELRSSGHRENDGVASMAFKSSNTCLGAHRSSSLPASECLLREISDVGEIHCHNV